MLTNEFCFIDTAVSIYSLVNGRMAIFGVLLKQNLYSHHLDNFLYRNRWKLSSVFNCFYWVEGGIVYIDKYLPPRFTNQPGRLSGKEVLLYDASAFARLWVVLMIKIISLNLPFRSHYNWLALKLSTVRPLPLIHDIKRECIRNLPSPLVITVSTWLQVTMRRNFLFLFSL